MQRAREQCYQHKPLQISHQRKFNQKFSTTTMQFGFWLHATNIIYKWGKQGLDLRVWWCVNISMAIMDIRTHCAHVCSWLMSAMFFFNRYPFLHVDKHNCDRSWHQDQVGNCNCCHHHMCIRKSYWKYIEQQQLFESCWTHDKNSVRAENQSWFILSSIHRQWFSSSLACFCQGLMNRCVLKQLLLRLMHALFTDTENGGCSFQSGH